MAEAEEASLVPAPAAAAARRAASVRPRRAAARRAAARAHAAGVALRGENRERAVVRRRAHACEATGTGRLDRAAAARRGDVGEKAAREAARRGVDSALQRVRFLPRELGAFSDLIASNPYKPLLAPLYPLPGFTT